MFYMDVCEKFHIQKNKVSYTIPNDKKLKILMYNKS